MACTSFAKRLKLLSVELYAARGQDGQVLATLDERLREVDEDIWVKAVLREMAVKGCHTNWLVSGARHKNEFRMLQEQGFTTIKLTVDDAVREARLVGTRMSYATYMADQALRHVECDHSFHVLDEGRQLQAQVDAFLQQMQGRSEGQRDCPKLPVP